MAHLKNWSDTAHRHNIVLYVIDVTGPTSRYATRMCCARDGLWNNYELTDGVVTACYYELVGEMLQSWDLKQRYYSFYE
jgi:hypothetical protein